jgi:hypothetical protein
MNKYIKILEDRMISGFSAHIIIKDILKDKYGELGELYTTTPKLTLEEWNNSNGTEDVYYDCRRITVDLYQRAVAFNYTTKQFN